MADEHLLSFMMLGFDVGGFEACQPPGYRVHMYIYLYAYIYIYVYAIPSFFSQGGETGSSICGKTGNDLRLCFLVKFETH